MKNNIKIDYISDLHINFIYPKKIFGKIIKYPKNPGKYLLLGGDFAENINLIKLMLDELIKDNLYEKILLIWGNHDIWLHKKDYKRYGIKNSIEKYNFLNKTFHNYKGKIHCLDVNPFISKEDKLLFCGSLSWYDYGIDKLDKSYLKKYFSANFDKMQFGNSFFNDKKYIKFGNGINNNIDFANYLYKILKNQVLELFGDKKYINYNKILLTHIKPSKNIDKISEYNITYTKKQWENIIYEKNNGIDVIKKYKLDYIYGEAFYINLKTQKLIEEFNIEYCIWGHSHSKNIEKNNGILYLTNCYGYHGSYNKNNFIEEFFIS